MGLWGAVGFGWTLFILRVGIRPRGSRDGCAEMAGLWCAARGVGAGCCEIAGSWCMEGEGSLMGMGLLLGVGAERATGRRARRRVRRMVALRWRVGGFLG